MVSWLWIIESAQPLSRLSPITWREFSVFDASRSIPIPWRDCCVGCRFFSLSPPPHPCPLPPLVKWNENLEDDWSIDFLAIKWCLFLFFCLVVFYFQVGLCVLRRATDASPGRCQQSARIWGGSAHLSPHEETGVLKKEGNNKIHKSWGPSLISVFRFFNTRDRISIVCNSELGLDYLFIYLCIYLFIGGALLEFGTSMIYAMGFSRRCDGCD